MEEVEETQGLMVSLAGSIITVQHATREREGMLREERKS